MIAKCICVVLHLLSSSYVCIIYFCTESVKSERKNFSSSVRKVIIIFNVYYCKLSDVFYFLACMETSNSSVG